MKRIGLFFVLLTLSVVGRVDGNCCGGGTFGVGIDYLYWKAYQDNLEFAISNGDINSTSQDITFVSPKFKAQSGVRVFADYTFCDCPWKLSAIYTHFDGKASQSNVFPAAAGTLLNLWGYPIFNVLAAPLGFASLNSSWRDHVNMLDLDVARAFCPCHNLTFTPHMGLRGLWMRQRFVFDGVVDFPETRLGPFQAKFYEHFDGYGVEAGVHGRLTLGCNFALVGHLGSSLLYARIKTQESTRSIVQTVVPVTATAKKTVHHLCPTLDTFLGIAYQRACWCYPVELHLGWEQHIFMNVSHLSLINFADLTLQGLTVGGSVRF